MTPAGSGVTAVTMTRAEIVSLTSAALASDEPTQAILESPGGPPYYHRVSMVAGGGVERTLSVSNPDTGDCAVIAPDGSIAWYGLAVGAVADFARRVAAERGRRFASANACRARRTYTGATTVARLPASVSASELVGAAAELVAYVRQEARRSGPRADVARDLLDLPAFHSLALAVGEVA